MKENHIGLKSFLPIYIFSAGVSRFLPDFLAVSVFVVCLIIFVAMRKQFPKRKTLLIVNYILLVFCSLHFFAFCLMKIPDGETYESPSDENAAESIAVILSLPLSFIFSLVAGILFDFWNNENLKLNENHEL